MDCTVLTKIYTGILYVIHTFYERFMVLFFVKEQQEHFTTPLIDLDAYLLKTYPAFCGMSYMYRTVIQIAPNMSADSRILFSFLFFQEHKNRCFCLFFMFLFLCLSVDVKDEKICADFVSSGGKILGLENLMMMMMSHER